MSTFHEKQKKALSGALTNRFPLTPEEAFYICACVNDLYFGPRSPNEDDPFPWRGFSYDLNRCEKVWQRIQKDIPSAFYWDMDCEALLDEEPMGMTDDITGEYYAPICENYWKVDSDDVKREIFGEELAEYL